MCMSSRASAQLQKKIRCTDGGQHPRVCPYKKGAGRIDNSPRMDSRFAMSDYSLWSPKHTCLRRQNLTTLCTAAGQNLAAVGSSHSFPETVDLGSVATAGLIGTLHLCTPPCKFTYARQPKTAAATHNYRPYMVMLGYYN